MTTGNGKNVVLLNAESDALTVSWPEIAGAVRYVLQYRQTVDEAFTTLSENLKSTQVRKKNLSGTDGFYFRVAAVTGQSDEQQQEWMTHPDPFRLLTAPEASTRMSAPAVVLGGSPHAGIIRWNESGAADTKYEIQMRENVGGAPWETIAASFANTEVKKKNLTSTAGYQFRVRPAGSDNHAFSPPSDPFVALGVSPGLQRLFQTLEKGTLIRKTDGKADDVSLEEALGGKEFVLLYASAHWCGPCRNFTPTLSQWYNALGPNKTVEVVFLSADHDEGGFDSYYASMPWLAVHFDEDTREELMSWIRVTGIPRLCVLDARTGRIIEDNAVGKPFDVDRWRSLATASTK